MAYKRKRSYKRRRPARRGGRTKALGRVGRRTVLGKRKMGADTVETKTAQYYANNFNVYPSNHASFATSIFPVSPYASYNQIDQGVGQGERIGNSINITRGTLKGTLYAAAAETYNTAPTPAMVIIRLFYYRAIPNQTPASLTGFLQQGDVAIDLQNRLTDAWMPVNENSYHMFYKKVFKIGYSGNGADTGMWTNNDFKLNANFTIPLTKYLIKKVKWSDTSTTMMQRGVWCSMQAVCANGSNYGATNIPVHCDWALDLRYKDA